MPVPKGKEGMRQNMEEFKSGTLHSGKGGPVVTSRKQAIAIGLSRTGMSRKSKREGNGRSGRR